MLRRLISAFRRMPISVKLVSITMSICLTALVLGAVLMFFIRVGVLLESQLHQMRLISDMAADYSYAPMDFNQPEGAAERLASLQRVPEISAAVLYDENEQEFARWERDPSKPQQLSAGYSAPISLFNKHFSVTRRVTDPDGIDAVGRVVVLAETHLLRKQVLDFLLALLTVALLVVVFVVMLAMRLQTTISGPIRELARVTAKVSEKADYSLRYQSQSDDEISQLGIAFNNLMQGIQDRDAETKRANDRLQEAHDDLERRVRMRTLQLEKTNALLCDSLDEKEMLLREVHHRVKNNLNVITSLLALHDCGEDGLVDASILRDAQQRIKTMSMVHETLYSAENLGELAAFEFVDRVVDSLKDMYQIAQRHIALRVDSGNIALDVTQAVPVGLIVNELVTNALKYAFQGRDSGIVEVQFSELSEHRLTLRVADNGIGIPELATLDKSETLGLRLVKALTRQIRGELFVSSESGTAFEIVFHRAIDISGGTRNLKNRPGKYKH